MVLKYLLLKFFLVRSRATCRIIVPFDEKLVGVIVGVNVISLTSFRFSVEKDFNFPTSDLSS